MEVPSLLDLCIGRTLNQNALKSTCMALISLYHPDTPYHPNIRWAMLSLTVLGSAYLSLEMINMNWVVFPFSYDEPI